MLKNLGLLLILIILATSIMSGYCIQSSRTGDAQPAVPNDHLTTQTAINQSEPASTNDLKFAFEEPSNCGEGRRERTEVTEHKITGPELEDLKRQLGICEKGRNYNQIIDGHGTGLRPPTDEEWADIAKNMYIAGNISSDIAAQSQSAVDHTADPWFPPIGDQDGEGSCTCWAVGYYMRTFQEAKEHGWNLTQAKWEGGYTGHPSPAYQEKIISPDFIYHLINWGVDAGSSFYRAIQLVSFVGASSWEKMPYNPSDPTSWPPEEAWREAPLYRANNSGYEYMQIDTNTALSNLKNWIASNHLALISVDGDKLKTSILTSTDFWTLDNYLNPITNHANTIVGYDDNIGYTENGQLRHGAFKIANSWGVGTGWENVPDGCYWISYEAMKQRVSYCYFYRDMTGYEPELAASFRINHQKRGECYVTVGLGNVSAPIATKTFNSYVYGGDYPFCQNNIILDITEFKDFVSTVYNQSYFLKVYDYSSTNGAIQKFAVEYSESKDTPLSTVTSAFVCANVTLVPLNTSWKSEQLVNADQDSVDGRISMAADSNGSLYVAYEDLYAAVGKCAIFVRRSTDAGNTWSVIRIGYDSSHDLHCPSITIDPSSNDVFVAVEREWTSSDRDVFVMRCVNGSWSWSAVANFIGNDDRFPSITCEYQSGSSRLYLSYEYVYNYDDRDLMFAKSTDHGATWSVKKLHGEWPDSNVYAQTSIISAEGYICIAYKYGVDYNSPCEIRVDRSSDTGESWTQFTNVDGLPNGCSHPSIAATHGSDEVMVAFEYAWSQSDIDACYSYSTDNGKSWTKGLSLFASRVEDERNPALAVDRDGAASSNTGGRFHAVCRVGSYAKYRYAYFSDMSNWSSSEFVNARWVGEGLALTTRYAGNTVFGPFVSLSDERIKSLYCSSYSYVPVEHETLIKSISFIVVRPSGPVSLKPVCTKVSTVGDPVHEGSLDVDSQWDLVGPEGLAELRVGVHTWTFGRVYTVGVTRCGVWEYRIQAPDKPLFVFPFISGWNKILDGYLVLDFPVS